MGCGARGLQTFTVNDPSVFLFIHQRPDRSTRCEFSPNCICQSAFFLSVCGIFLSFSFFLLLRLPFKVHHLCSVLFCSWISPVQSEIFWRDPEGDILCLGDPTTFCQVDIYVSVYDLENLRCQVGGAVYWCVDGGQKWYQLIGTIWDLSGLQYGARGWTALGTYQVRLNISQLD